MADTPPPDIENLNPSQLGTKEYWDDAYNLETTNFRANPADEGTIWFDESNAEDRILEYLNDELSLSTSDTTFLDLGTGNGHLLFYLREEGGFMGEMVGVDYSERSVQLCNEILRKKTSDHEEDEDGEGEVDYSDISFRVADVVRDGVSGVWDVVLDKGTLDAVSLAGEVLEGGRRIEDVYVERMADAVRDGGWAIVTSCNWTEEELRRRIGGVGGLQYYGSVKYPSFQFGGRKGQTICTLCFRKV